MTYKIYRIINEINGKSYIGFTQKDIQTRFREHIYSAMKRNSHFRIHQAIRKYGENSFCIELLDSGDNEIYVLNTLEPKYIKKYNSIDDGYNTLLGGNIGRTPSKFTSETRKKMSENNRWRGVSRSGENGPMFGKKHTEATRKLMSEKKRGKSHRGHPTSEETKVKLSKAARERFESGAWVPPLKGKKMSEESRRRLSESKTGKISYTKTYQVLFPDGHTEITANMAQFCRDRGLNKSNMYAVAKGKLKQYRGFRCVEIINNE